MNPTNEPPRIVIDGVDMTARMQQELTKAKPDDERARFEAWAALNAFTVRRDGIGAYLDSTTAALWVGWNARSQSAPAAQSEAVGEVVPVKGGDRFTQKSVWWYAGNVLGLPLGTKLYTTPQPRATGRLHRAATAYFQKFGWPDPDDSRELIELASALAAQLSADDAPRAVYQFRIKGAPEWFDCGEQRHRYYRSHTLYDTRITYAAPCPLADNLPRDVVPSNAICPGCGMLVFAAPPADARDADVEAFLSEVRAELIRARAEFPGDRIMTIALAEEFGELCKAVLDESAAHVRKEAVQTAVMAARIVLDGDGSVRDWRREKNLDPLAADRAMGGE